MRKKILRCLRREWRSIFIRFCNDFIQQLLPWGPQQVLIFYASGVLLF